MSEREDETGNLDRKSPKEAFPDRRDQGDKAR